MNARTVQALPGLPRALYVGKYVGCKVYAGLVWGLGFTVLSSHTEGLLAA